MLYKSSRKPVIRIKQLGKQYRLGVRRTPYGTLRESITKIITHPLSSLLHNKRNQQDRFWALKDVDIDIFCGEVVGIIGRNGAGKSTLLKILSRITEPTTGSISLFGRVGSLLEVGTGFHPELSGRDNIFLNGAILGMKRYEITRHFDAIVEFAGVDTFLDTPVKHYSSGMYTRLAFAVAAHLEPEILVVDEVLAVGDAGFQKKCLGKMREVAQEGRTVLFVSHNLAAVRSLCQRSVLLINGKVAHQGSPEECIAKYQSQIDPSHHKSKVEFQLTNRHPRMLCASILCNNEESTSFEFGDAISFEIDFMSDSYSSDYKIGFIISNSSGDRILNANNRYQDYHSYTTPTKFGKIRCELGPVPLMPDQYYVSLHFGTPVEDTHVVENAFCFEVKESYLWRSKQLPPPRCSLMWWPTQFVMK